jgi:hypothetical protein
MKHRQPGPFEDEWGQNLGEQPPGDPDWLERAVPEDMESEAGKWAEGLPDSHEAVIKLAGHEVPLSGLVLKAGGTAREYTAHAVEGAGRHKKEIAIGAVTVAGVLLAAKTIHARRKSKK